MSLSEIGELFGQCLLQIYLVMIKTESYNVSGGKHSARTQDFQEECVNYLVEVMDDDKDITPDDPMRHTFSVFLSRNDYVPSVWHSFTHSGMDRYDWFLRVVLVSKGEYLIQRNFPVVIVES